MSDPESSSDAFFPDPVPDEDPGRTRVSARSVVIWGARATGGLVGVGVAAAVAIAAVFVTPPSWSITPPVVEVQPEPAQQTLVCPGPLLRLADDSGQNASSATPISTRPYAAFSADSGSLERSAIEQSDAGTGGTSLAPQLGIVTPVDGASPIVAGVQSDRAAAATGGNVVGYVAASCESPTLRSWIIGGSTQLGRTSILTLVNPTSVEATVDLELYAETGSVDAVGLEGIVVPAGSQRVIPVNGLALEQRAPVIGIVSSGGNVAAYVQESIIRTLVPGGVDLTGQQTPSTTLVIPGIAVLGEDALAPVNATSIDEDDTMPTLRLFAPDASTVEATVALIPAGSTLADALAAPEVDEGSVPTDAHEPAPATPEPKSFDVRLTAGTVSELPLSGVAKGEYTVVVSASAPIVGAVRASTTGKAGTDFAWYSPAAELGDRALVTTPDASTVVLAISNATQAERAVVLTGPDGDLPLTIPAGGSISTPLQSKAEYSLSGMSGLRAAVRSGEADSLVAQFPLLPPAALAEPVLVHP